MGSKTTQKTEFPPPTQQELDLMEFAVDAMMPTYMEELGYETTKTSSVMADDPKYKAYLDELTRAEDEYATIQPRPGQPSDPGTLQAAQNKINRAQQNIDNFQSEWAPTTEYEVREKESPEVERIRAQYGEGSTEYKDAHGAYVAQKEKDWAANDTLQRSIMDKTQKFLNGDFSITPEQKQFVQNSYAPIREAVNVLYDNVIREGEETGKALSDSIGEYEKRIKQTGLDIGDALSTLGEQVKQTGYDMDKALTNTIKVRESLMKMGIEDATGAITKNVANNAAAIGRSPDDPEYQNEIQANVAREVRRGQLELGQVEAQGRLGIAERTGGGLEDVARQRAAVAERTGAGLEEAAIRRAGVTERTGSIREAAAQGRGEAAVGIEKDIANTEYQMGAGMAPTQVGTALNVEQFNQALAQQRVANAAAGFQAPYGVAQGMQGYRMAQPTTTTTKSFGVGDILGTVFGGLSGIAGAI